MGVPVVDGVVTIDELLALRPELHSAYSKLLGHPLALLGADRLALVSGRMAELHGLGASASHPVDAVDAVDAVDRRVLDFVELFVIDVHAITDDLAAQLVADLGDDGLIALGSACAVLDGFSKLLRVMEVSP